MIWTVVIACLFLAGYIFMRMQRREEHKQAENDTGLAILEFGQAYPNEAIREVISTVNGDSVFLRLHDGKVGCMRAHGKHFTSHVIEPGSVRVRNTASGNGLALDFTDNAYENGRFEFRTSADAAEVSLWLLGSLVPAAGIDESPAAISS
ncbi:hypothetical protein IB238_05930 [Rhizobium sp. ARZ01]|uniref:hypothetical protein n=1 Tax=Rhizobium sp. ARZ01 TaxID=2769313 RepID=UPI001783CEE8|nr:hypothetical protein [Rhizobium sp. ARZ01]MBD9372168.1 hypothetical protein [Rhizobium sp. ARZ01]